MSPAYRLDPYLGVTIIRLEIGTAKMYGVQQTKNVQENGNTGTEETGKGMRLSNCCRRIAMVSFYSFILNIEKRFLYIKIDKIDVVRLNVVVPSFI